MAGVESVTIIGAEILLFQELVIEPNFTHSTEMSRGEGTIYENLFPSVDRQIYRVTPWGILPYLELCWQAFF